MYEHLISYEGQELGWVSNITNPTKQGGIVSSKFYPFFSFLSI